MVEKTECETIKKIFLDMLKNDVNIDLDVETDYYGNHTISIKLIYTNPSTGKRTILDESSDWLPGQV